MRTDPVQRPRDRIKTLEPHRQRFSIKSLLLPPAHSLVDEKICNYYGRHAAVGTWFLVSKRKSTCINTHILLKFYLLDFCFCINPSVPILVLLLSSMGLKGHLLFHFFPETLRMRLGAWPPHIYIILYYRFATPSLITVHMLASWPWKTHSIR